MLLLGIRGHECGNENQEEGAKQDSEALVHGFLDSTPVDAVLGKTKAITREWLSREGRLTQQCCVFGLENLRLR